MTQYPDYEFYGHILSIQSHVAYGHVGNRAATFPLERLGFDVWPVNTVQFSNHTGYGKWRGDVFAADHIDDLIGGIEDLQTPQGTPVLAGVKAVLSGYMGDKSICSSICQAVAKTRHYNKQALYVCDPVMGDVGRGFFVREGLPEVIRDQAVPLANIVTPNQFELEYLVDGKITNLTEAIEAGRELTAQGPDYVLLTSLRRAEADPQKIEMLVIGKDEAYLVATPIIPITPAPNGSGDATASLFLGHYLRSGSVAEALGATAAAIYEIFEQTFARQQRELQLIAAQGAFVKSRYKFEVQKVR